MNVLTTGTRVGPYMGVTRDEVRRFGNNRTFRFLLYGAYNACGLIGPECNGIAVLDEDKREVICDEIAKRDTGYFGASNRQEVLFEILLTLPWDEFRALVNEQKRLRVSI